MDISGPHLQLIIQSVRDAMRLIKRELDDQGENPDAELEEYMSRLDLLQGDLKREYERMRAAGANLVPYDLLIGRTRFRKL